MVLKVELKMPSHCSTIRRLSLGVVLRVETWGLGPWWGGTPRSLGLCMCNTQHLQRRGLLILWEVVAIGKSPSVICR